MRASGLMEDAPGEDRIVVGEIEFAKGDKIRLKLGGRLSDAADVLLDGRIATIENIYRDYADEIYLAVTLDDDPAQEMLRELGRYMFFKPEEVEHD